MTKEDQEKITKLSKAFAEQIGVINNSGWIIVDPLAAYLSSVGFKNKIMEMPGSKKRPQVLIIEFKDGTQFIPAGGDLKPIDESFKNWMWIE